MEKIGHLTRYLGFEQSSSRLIFWDLILFYWLSADRSINDTKFPNSPNVQGPSSGHLFQWNTIKNPPRRSKKRAPFRILYVLVLRYLNIIFFRCFEHCVRYPTRTFQTMIISVNKTVRGFLSHRNNRYGHELSSESPETDREALLSSGCSSPRRVIYENIAIMR